MMELHLITVLSDDISASLGVGPSRRIPTKMIKCLLRVGYGIICQIVFGRKGKFEWEQSTVQRVHEILVVLVCGRERLFCHSKVLIIAKVISDLA